MPELPQNEQPSAAFAEFFNALLDSQGLTGASGARRLGVAQSQVSRWKRGEGGISLENLQRIHEEFGADLDYLKQLAGLRTSNPATTKDELDAERQLWRSRYEYLIEKKVPHWAREAYIAACEALAEAYQQMRPGALNSPGSQAINRSGAEIEPGSPGPEEQHLTDLYRPRTSTYRFETASA